MIGRAWRAIRRGIRAETTGWAKAKAIIASVQAPAPETSPPRVPGKTGAGDNGPPVPTRAAETPPRQSPAPGRPHGGVAYHLVAWNDGRMRLWDGTGHLYARRECACPPRVDLSDAAIARFLDDQH